ncbi:MAG: 4Fe-4S binding protein [Planctomycetes bacterium]|nr:4Fe-4S binding protein [Planctomycetota bacterium]
MSTPPPPPAERPSWLGGLFRRIGRAAAAAPSDEQAAIDRRAFLTGKMLRPMVDRLSEPLERAGNAAAAVIAAEQRAGAVTAAQGIARTFPVLRPPGAVAEADFLAGCTRCGDCLPACPHGAIIKAPERMRAVAGSPIIDPASQPCLMCPDTPCISACQPQVLRREAGYPVPSIGTARIQPLDCLAHQNSTCSSCAERCPVPGAIVLDQGRPRVVADLCTGCGICHHVCPAPRNAVIMLPLLGRQPIPKDRL